ncbi:MAG TPA: type II toxin-antitoxin system RatA family toxin [Steroidobacteraceae bacterium]|nr:type II toxin-antitoxin system RatA family toxin [Steroidobacteraceae bacterium]
MREVKRSALVSQPPARIYALINDVERYPEFVPWCTQARVLSRSPAEIVAALHVRQGALSGEFTTRNTLTPESAVHMQLVSGPFRLLEGAWQLSPIAPHGCRVELDVRFEFKSRLSGMLFESLFANTVASLVDAFVQRARTTA